MQGLPPLRLLVTFESVARLGTMREAAGALNVTQAAVTQAIRQLEDHVGVVLLDRSTKPARLTAGGQMLARAVRDGLGAIAATIEDMRAAASTDHLQVTIACTLGMATHWLMPRLPEFHALHPDVAVNIQAPPTDLPALSPGIDIALRYGTGSWRDGTTSLLFAERVCPAGHPAVVERVLERSIPLSQAPLIHVRSAHNPHWAGWAEYLSRRGQGKPAGPGLSFDNYVHAVQAALDGRGLMLGWRSITGRLVAAGALAEWPDGGLDIGTGYHMTVAPGAAHKQPVQALAQWLAGLPEGEPTSAA